jgi:hypothetical protein
MGVTLTLGVLFADVVYEGHVRHWGIAFVSFVVGLWLQNVERADRAIAPAKWPISTYALLALSALAGFVAIVSSWHRPFSRARETAKWIEENVPAGTLITGRPDVNLASPGEEMQRPIYFLECQCFDTFKLFAKSRDGFGERELPGRLNEALDKQGRQSLVFISAWPMPSEEYSDFARHHLDLKVMKEFGGAEMENENFFIYQVTKAHDK